jgi:hypothetical protein
LFQAIVDTQFYTTIRVTIIYLLSYILLYAYPIIMIIMMLNEEEKHKMQLVSFIYSICLFALELVQIVRFFQVDWFEILHFAINLMHFIRFDLNSYDI